MEGSPRQGRRAVAYCRVSKEDRLGKGVSVEVQVEKAEQ